MARDLSEMLAEKEEQVQQLLTRITDMEEDRAVLFEEAQRGLAMGAEMVQISDRLTVGTLQSHSTSAIPVVLVPGHPMSSSGAGTVS